MDSAEGLEDLLSPASTLPGTTPWIPILIFLLQVFLAFMTFLEGYPLRASGQLLPELGGVGRALTHLAAQRLTA